MSLLACYERYVCYDKQMPTMIHEAVAPDMVLVHDLNAEVLPDACGAKGCYPDRLCARCRLKAGDACEACGAPGEVVDEDVLCRKCAAPVCWYCEAPATERRKERAADAAGSERDVCEQCADDLRRGDELDRRAADREAV